MKASTTFAIFAALVMAVALSAPSASAAGHMAGKMSNEGTAQHMDHMRHAEGTEAHPLGLPQMNRTAPGIMREFGHNYWYLPYAVTNDDQLLAFTHAFAKVVQSDKPLPEQLTVPDGEGAAGSNYLPRMSNNVTRYFIRDINDPAATAVSTSDIPVVIAQPQPGDDGANVLYLDGHVKFVHYGQFPVTRQTIQALSALDPPDWSNQ